ncbi:MAG: hypothetical protein Q7V05_06135 [Methanoregula sp.]|nr:hypothetical protein [Methanoregula sp.]
MTVPPALLSHESTEHYTPQYILDAVISCMGAIDLDPCSNSQEIPNVPAARSDISLTIFHPPSNLTSNSQYTSSSRDPP